MKHSIIITAGGIGKRMNSDIPKQFLIVGELPILMHSINTFYEFDESAQLIVTLPSDWWSYWNKLCEKHKFNVPVVLVEGGIERYDSIKNALSRCIGDLIAVHDGVRPFVSQETIKRCFQSAKEKGSGVPILQLKESLRKGSFSENQAQDRKSFFSVQTPQCFQRSILISAYKQHFSKNITDDASLVEQTGHQVQLVEGNEENIKITTPFDLSIAQTIDKF